MKPKIIIIQGPTGVGKSDIAVDVALEIGAEIINADSQQVYRYMDIGSGKPLPEQRRRVPHHLIDIVDPDEDFDAAMFRERALESAREIRSRERKVLVCGGTGLYIKALLYGLFTGPAKDPEIRKSLEQEAAEKGLPALYGKLREIDPDASAWIHPNDRQRIIRALEVFSLTGKRMSEWQRDHGFRGSEFEALKIGLNRERGELYDRINRRCHEMVAQGLVEEVKGLRERGYDLNLKALQSVGYRHVGLYLKGLLSLEEALSLMKRDTRRLAKRQLTWFRHEHRLQWLDVDNEDRAPDIAEKILKNLK